MIFSSITHIYIFLPVLLLVYAAAPKKIKNSVLFIFSLIFYAWGERLLVLLFVFSILLGWLFGLGIEKTKGSKLSGLLLTLSILFDAGLLFYFKYTDFFIQTANSLLKTNIPLLQIALPIGISFYTFQLISYEIDIFKGSVPAQKNFINFGTYVALFPQLIAGPIVRYKDIQLQLTDRNHSLEKISDGITRFITGFAKKVLIANSLGELIVFFRNSSQPSLLFYWIYALAFTLQLYFDFSGYSDMAIGLGKFFGFDFPENFDYPYTSRTATEFWRRWHITLGTWFKDYIYIPLGGNKKGFKIQIRNIFAVWMLTGLWHGAAWNFVLWGLYYAIILIVEKLFLKKWMENHRIISHIYLLILTLFGFVLFNSENLYSCLNDFKCLLGFGSLPFTSAETLYYLKSYAVTLIFALAGATPFIKIFVTKIKSGKLADFYYFAEPVILLVLLILGTASLVDGSFNPFLYFRF